MINEKMRMLGAKRSAIRELFEYGLKRKREIGEENVFDFSLGNPSVPAPVELSEGMRGLLSEVDPILLFGYTSAQGDAGVRAALADYISRLHSYPCDKDELYITVGAAAALCCSLHAVVSPGEEVVLLSPYFPEYKVFVEGCGGVVREVACDSGSFHPDIEALSSAINERTAAVIINSPNNPTGAVYSEVEISEIGALLENKSREIGKPIYLISDEPYRELVYDGIAVPFIPKYYRNTIVCYSFSKSLSIPGERIGYVFVPGSVNQNRQVYEAICGAGRTLGYVCAPSLMQRALPLCLGLTADVSIYDRNRRLLCERLTSLGFSVVKPEGAFYLFLKSPIPDAVAFCEAAKRHELLLVPSDSFGCGGYVRISYCVKTEMIERALPAFSALAADFGLV